MLCLPWGSEHPQFPGTAGDTGARSDSQVSHERQERSGTSVEVQRQATQPVAAASSSFLEPDVPPFTASTPPYRDTPPVVDSAPVQPLAFPQASDPDYDPHATYTGLDDPMTPNTAAIWMALIQYTEPDVLAAPATSGQAILGQYEAAGYPHTGEGDPAYGMVGTGVGLTSGLNEVRQVSRCGLALSLIPFQADEVLTMEYGKSPLLTHNPS